MAIFLEGEIRGGDRNKPRVYITGGSDLYKGKTLDCTAGNDLSGVRKVAVVVSGMVRVAYSQIAGLKPSDVRYRERTRKKPRVKPKPVGASLKVLFTKETYAAGHNFFNPGVGDNFVWYVGGDRKIPMLIHTDTYDPLLDTNGNGWSWYEWISFNNMGFGDKFVGYLDRQIYSSDPVNTFQSDNLLTRVFFKDSGSLTPFYSDDMFDQIHNINTDDYDLYEHTVKGLSLTGWSYSHRAFGTFEYNFMSMWRDYVESISTGDTFTNRVVTTTNIDEYTGYIYKGITLQDEFIHKNETTINVQTYTSTNWTYNYSDIACLLTPDKIIDFPVGVANNSSDDETYELIGFNDKKTQSLGVHKSSAGQVYRWYTIDTVNNTVSYKTMLTNELPSTINILSGGWNWIGSKLYLADAWINDTNDEFYSTGSYIADEDKWIVDSEAIVRVYELKLNPLDSDKFIIEQTDAFLFPVLAVVPPDYVPGSSSGTSKFYNVHRLSYHPG